MGVHIEWNEDGIRKATQEAVLAAGPRHIAEIERLTAGIRCGVHGTAPVYEGPWPTIAFEDFCCEDLKRQTIEALQGVSWIN
jgi:hypothetical protein